MTERTGTSYIVAEDVGADRHLVLNFGPQHPATHGTLRIVMEIEGERIRKARQEIGFLHTGFEKLGEHLTYTQFITLTDRMNYLSAICNNVGFAVAVEELMGIEPPPRAQVLRVIMAEMTRIADHILCVGLQAMDLGAFSCMLWAFKEREKIYDLIEACCGSRLTTSWTRIGGIMRDVPADFDAVCRRFLSEVPETIREIESMLNENRIWHERLDGKGAMTRAQAMDRALSGPVLRASGVATDVRRARPYIGYETYDFEVAVQTAGDAMARYHVRVKEMKESAKIIRQALDRLQPGPVNLASKKKTIPEKDDVYSDMESLIHHFEQVMWGHGARPPAHGEVYSATEAPNGELGYYVVSDGSYRPYRVRVRPPSFVNFAAYAAMVEGLLISDAVAVLSSLNVIAGELDR